MSASGILWTASPIKHYGYGSGRAHPSVEFVACPVCEAPKGSLCIGSDGTPHLDRHYKRYDAYRELRRKAVRIGGPIVQRFFDRLARRQRIESTISSRPRLTRGSRFAVCGFRGCTRTGSNVFTTGMGKDRVRHWYCCSVCGTEFVKRFR